MRNEVTINNLILNFSCAPNWTGADDYAQFYNIILMIFGFFFPTMILLITNVAVLRTSNKVSRMCFNHTRANITRIYRHNQWYEFHSYFIFSKKDGVEQIVFLIQSQCDILPSKTMILMNQKCKVILQENLKIVMGKQLFFSW